MHIRQEVLELLLVEDIGVTFHLPAPYTNDLPNAGIVSRNAAHGKVWPFEDALEPRSLPPSSRVRIMAAIAVGVVELPSARLLRIEAQFCVAFATLGFATQKKHEREHPQRQETGYQQTRSQMN